MSFPKVLLAAGLAASLATAVRAEDRTVTIDGKTFSTKEVRMKKGDRLVVVNRSPFNHWIWGHGGDFAWDLRSTNDNNLTHKPRETHAITMHHPGVYRMGCAIHPNMLIKVVVAP